MVVNPAEARRIARDYVVSKQAPPSYAKVRVSDFGALSDGGYSVLVDVTLGTTRSKDRTRYRVKMDKNGKITSFVAR